MSPSIKSLRRSVLAGGAVLLLVLAGFLGIARLRGYRFHLDLPSRLGVDISQTANGFTYSQSSKGHTLFTIHASKLVQYKGDQAELHDVTITLYGPEGTGRTDKIYGSDFTYNQKQGIARASGAVRIDFASPDMKAQGNALANTPSHPAAGAASAAVPNTIHVTTSGVTFNQKTGEATTDQHVDFLFTRAAGSATGADYNSKTGVLVLDHDVAFTTNDKGKEAVIHASHAQLYRETHQAYLLNADSTFGGEQSTADQATVTFRPDGSAQNVDARGHVHLTLPDGAKVHSSSAVVDLDEQSQPLVANLDGGVTYNAGHNGETMQGIAVSGTLGFAPAPNDKPHAAQPTMQVLHHAQFRDAVSFVVQQNALPGDPNGSSTREMHGSTVDIDFAQGPEGKAEAQHAQAVGGASVTLHDIPSHAPAKSTTISGDLLLATLAHGRELKVMDGKGHTKIFDTAPDGATSTSTGDTLHMTFVPTPGGQPAKPGASATAQVDTAVQQGNVVMLQVPAPDAKNSDGSRPAPLHASAAQAEYHASDEVLHLTGDPHLRNDTLAMTADKVDYHRDSGDAAAWGDVKATYIQEPAEQGTAGAPAQASGPSLGGDGPVHVVADHAQLTRSTSLSIFYGSASALARMWQGGDAVAAPVLELSRVTQTLDAHGAPGQRGAVVHSTLGVRADKGAGNGSSASSGGSAKGPAASAGTNPFAQGSGALGGAPSRLTSETLHYSDKERRADLRGAVVAEQPNGTIHADQAVVYLTPNVPGKPSGVDHIVATHHVVITQPGRRGTGDKLVYTAADGRYVLTGSPGQLPRMSDTAKGTTTGAALIFRSPDDSVEVSNQADQGASSASSAGSAPADRHPHTVTDTHSPR